MGYGFLKQNLKSYYLYGKFGTMFKCNCTSICLYKLLYLTSLIMKTSKRQQFVVYLKKSFFILKKRDFKPKEMS